jgi:hypothetical protein
VKTVLELIAGLVVMIVAATLSFGGDLRLSAPESPRVQRVQLADCAAKAAPARAPRAEKSLAC